MSVRSIAWSPKAYRARDILLRKHSRFVIIKHIADERVPSIPCVLKNAALSVLAHSPTSPLAPTQKDFKETSYNLIEEGDRKIRIHSKHSLPAYLWGKSYQLFMGLNSKSNFD